MNPLLDSLLSALIVSDCRGVLSPIERLKLASGRVEELLRSTSFPDTAKLLKQYREECIEPLVVKSEVDPPTPVAAVTRRHTRKRRKAVA